jgi:DNA-binding CsgD family transcriptional regulator
VGQPRRPRAPGSRPTNACADQPARDSLTLRERQIAMLDAAGLTNKEIGQQLFLSHRTVAAHLYQIFPKLGITTRAALRDALAELPEPLRARSSVSRRADGRMKVPPAANRYSDLTMSSSATHRATLAG